MDFDEAMSKAVTSKPVGFSYTRPFGKDKCQYVHHSPRREAGCLIATALELMGVSLDFMEQYENGSSNPMMGQLKRDGVIDVTHLQIAAAGEAQSIQDMGETWSDCLLAYREFIEDES